MRSSTGVHSGSEHSTLQLHRIALPAPPRPPSSPASRSSWGQRGPGKCRANAPGTGCQQGSLATALSEAGSAGSGWPTCRTTTAPAAEHRSGGWALSVSSKRQVTPSTPCVQWNNGIHGFAGPLPIRSALHPHLRQTH